MLCPKCGRPLVENAPYCVHCGTLFEGIGTVEAGEIDLQPDELIIMKGKKQPFQKTKKVKIIVGFSIPLTVILLAGILVAVFFPQIQRSVMGESIYYFYKEAQCASSVFSADAISVLRHPSSYAAESVVTASVQNDSDVNQILQPLQILANVVYDQDTGTVQSSAHLQGSGNDILMVEGDYMDGNFLLSSPQADNTLMFPNPFSGRRKVASHKDVGDTYSFSASYQGVYSKILQAVVDADREALLNVLKKVCTSELDKHSSVSTKIWNERNCRTVTFKFTGADLENLTNEAALAAAKANRKAITMKDIEEATIKVMAGPEKKSHVVTDKEKNLTAYHEAGHAICTYHCSTQEPVHQVSIIPRGQAGGYTMSLPGENINYRTKREMEENIVVLLGGRMAELLILGDISTGASNDLERATKMARAMVTRYGFSDAVGPIVYGQDPHEVFLGRDFSSGTQVSEKVTAEIDEEVRRIIETAYERARTILSEHADQLHRVAEYLKVHEKINRDTFERLVENRLEEEAEAPQSPAQQAQEQAAGDEAQAFAPAQAEPEKPDCQPEPQIPDQPQE